MSTPIIIPKRTKKKHREHLRTKTCAFPGCSIRQKMTGRGKYCTEHKKRKYRKIIDAGKIEAKRAAAAALSPNQTLKHHYNEAIILSMKCQLPGCENEFEIKVFPNIFLYPKYCPEHRNEYKRQRFLETNSIERK